MYIYIYIIHNSMRVHLGFLQGLGFFGDQLRHDDDDDDDADDDDDDDDADADDE